MRTSVLSIHRDVSDSRILTLLLVAIVLATGYPSTKAQDDFAPKVFASQQILSPKGGEVFKAGDAIKVAWDVKSFSESSLLTIMLWNTDGGSWSVIDNSVPNSGFAFVVLSERGNSRFRVQDSRTGEFIQMGGYFVVQGDQTTDKPSRGQDQDESALTMITTNQLEVLLSNHPKLSDANVDIVTIDGRMVEYDISIPMFFKKYSGTVLINNETLAKPEMGRIIFILLK